MGFNEIPGQIRVKRFLMQLYRMQRIPHAMMFCGMVGTGKKSVALEFAKLINCLEREPGGIEAPDQASACGVCTSCHKLSQGSHPDLFVIAKQGAFIKIEQIRELRERFRFNPFEAKFRVVIVDNAQDLKEEAGNSLLKMLEEPPKRNIFMLLVPEAQMLLPTIVSRCCKVRFQPVPTDWITGHLDKRYHLDPAVCRQIAEFSGGSVKRAEAWVDNERLTRFQEIMDRITRFESMPMLDFFALMEQWAKEDTDLEQDLECIKYWLREELLYRAGKGAGQAVLGPVRVPRLPGLVSIEMLHELFEQIEKASVDLRYFANKQLILEGVCLKIKDLFDGEGRRCSVQERR